MIRTYENCALIKTNIKAGREKPLLKDNYCVGYLRRNSLHQTCKKCPLCIKNIK